MEKYIKQVEDEIVDIMIKAFEERKLTRMDLTKIANLILERVKKIKTHDEIIGMLSEISVKWPVFTPLATIEEGKLKRVIETKTAQDVLKLIKGNQIEMAIKLAQSVT